MIKSDTKYQTYLEILKEEMISAAGCTEPVAIAMAAAKARDALGQIPDGIVIKVSENIIKNAKSVVVPNTNNLKGIEAAICAGIIVGKPEKNLEVISHVSRDELNSILTYKKNTPISVSPLDSEYIFDIELKVFYQEDYVKIRMVNHHTNVVMLEKNGQVIFAKDYIAEEAVADDKKRLLSVKEIIEFANDVNIDDIKELIEKQIQNNTAIAEEGLRGTYGANIGRVLLNAYGNAVHNRAKAKAAAASDARMSGSCLPVMIIAGSGNQGLTASLPVIEYAHEHSISHEKLLRALVVSNLVSIHQKTGIGPLSAYCGVVFAGAGSGAGIAYLNDGDFETIAHTIVNALAILSGMICDGAKPSCAAKIAMAVDAGILGYDMYLQGQQFYGGDGIIAKGIENTLANVTRLARQGMRITDQEIVKIMTENPK